MTSEWVLNQQGEPLLKVSKPTFDMGIVLLNEVGKANIQIQNTGSAPLKIEKVEPG